MCLAVPTCMESFCKVGAFWSCFNLEMHCVVLKSKDLDADAFLGVMSWVPTVRRKRWLLHYTTLQRRSMPSHRAARSALCEDRADAWHRQALVSWDCSETRKISPLQGAGSVLSISFVCMWEQQDCLKTQVSSFYQLCCSVKNGLSIIQSIRSETSQDNLQMPNTSRWL